MNVLMDTNHPGPVDRANNRQVDIDEWDLGEPANVQPQNGPGVQPQVNGREALGNARVVDLEADLRAHVPARHSFGKRLKEGLFSAFRGIMKFCHVIHNAFTGAPKKKHRQDFEDAMRARTGQGAVVNVRIANANADEYALSNGEVVQRADVVTYSDREIGAAMGLAGSAHVKPFNEGEIRQIVDGNFNLNDIKQDPNLQDCWFLSSLTSVLSFKGSSYLQKLITIPQEGNGNANFALVKLGNNAYKVPLGDVVGKGGESGTSSSKAWVRLLETAMQMHMMNLHQREVTSAIRLKVDMNGGAPNLALGALLGLENVEQMDTARGPVLWRSDRVSVIRPSANSTLNSCVERISRALGGNTPVVLASSDDAVLKAAKYGFSPGHAVSVQDVEWKGGHCYLHILDPYNRSVVLDADILLKDATVYIGAENA